MTEKNSTKAVKPLVSVLTVSFNAIDGLRKTVESVDAQTFTDLEHVIVDGGSTDGSVEYLQSRIDDRLNWISEPDEGIADALNKGFALARGEWVIVLGAEDTFFGPESVQQAVREFSADVDVVAFDIISVRDGRDYRLSTPRPARRLILKPLHHQGIFCRRNLMCEVGSFNSEFKVCMDYEWFVRAKRHGIRFKSSKTIVSRMPATGISSRLDWRSLQDRFAEERLVQKQYSQSFAARWLYAIYWPLYLSYRKLWSVLR
ncbi:MAG: glycosyltransferase family 2 protein [Congregibacter sp.]